MSNLTITILGAGAMGSAIATPLADAGHRVRLWGTRLDDALVAGLRAGRPHPRTGGLLPAGVETYLAPQLAEALAGADLVVLAVSSVGVAPVMQLAAPLLGGVEAILVCSKGFADDSAGRVRLLPDVMAEILAAHGGRPLPIVAIGGPCKANEVAARTPTAAIYAAPADPQRYALLASTPHYRVAASTDLAGVELCAALKNVYAIALGVADGLDAAGQPHHDLKAAIFAQGLAELRVLLVAEGCDPWTALGLAGAGDLEVTGLSGRNKVYGMRLGQGEQASRALAEMVAAHQTVEGVPAATFALRFVTERHPEMVGQLPLLGAINRVVHDGADLFEIVEAALPGRVGDEVQSGWNDSSHG